MATGRVDVSRVRSVRDGGLSRGVDGRVRDVRGVGWKRSAHEVVRGLDVRSGFSCRDEVVGRPGGLLGRSKHVVAGDFEDGEILPVDGDFQLPPEKKRKVSSTTLNEERIADLVDDYVVENCGVALESPLVSAQSDLPSHGSVVDDEQGPKGEELVEPRNAYMSRWGSDEDDVPGDNEVVLSGSRSRSMESDCRDSSVGFSGPDEDSESELDNQVPIDDDKSKKMPSDRSMDSPERSVDMCQGCRSVFEYERLNEISEGTYGKVYRARDKMTGDIVALKKVKINADMEEYGFPITALREINLLNSLYHPNIVNVKEVVMGDLDSIFMVMECMDHDLKGVMEVMKQPFSTSDVKCLMLQLLEGVKYLHDNWVLHRDLKTSNILLNNNGELKICDFGMSRNYGSPLKPYTPLVVTLWYRAPELLLGAEKYSTSLDMWSVGCIMAELLTKTPLFNGKNEIDQLAKIFRMLGTPNETTWPGFSALPGAKAKFVQQPDILRKKFPAVSFMGSPVLSGLGYDLLSKLLAYDPEKRITADDALNHPWFHEAPLPKAKEFLPTFPPQSARTRNRDATKKRLGSNASLKQMCTIVRYYLFLVKQIGVDQGIKILSMIPRFIIRL